MGEGVEVRRLGDKERNQRQLTTERWTSVCVCACVRTWAHVRARVDGMEGKVDKEWRVLLRRVFSAGSITRPLYNPPSSLPFITKAWTVVRALSFLCAWL